MESMDLYQEETMVKKMFESNTGGMAGRVRPHMWENKQNRHSKGKD